MCVLARPCLVRGRKKGLCMFDPKMARYGFIGAGNMAQALITGLLREGISPNQILVCSPNETELAALKDRFRIEINTDNQAACKADILILAVKPQVMKPVIEGLQLTPTSNPLILSVAAGIRTDQIQRWFRVPAAVIRIMPNTPALKQLGALGLYASPTISADKKQQAEMVCQCIGMTEWVSDESLMDVVTALSGSGPAYFFYWVEALIEAATALGLPEKTAKNLCYQTMLGAAHMLLDGEDSASTLRQKVTSPKGTTEKGIQVLEQHQMKKIILSVLQEATKRGQSMAQEWDLTV